MIEHLKLYAEKIGKEEIPQIMDGAAEWMDFRKSYYEKPTPIKYFKLIKYHRYYFRLRSWVKDFFIARAH